MQQGKAIRPLHASPGLHQSHPTVSTRCHHSRLQEERQILTPWRPPSRCSTDGNGEGAAVSAGAGMREALPEQCVKSYSFFLTPAPRDLPAAASLPASIWLITPSCLVRKAGESRELELALPVLAPGRNSHSAWVPLQLRRRSLCLDNGVQAMRLQRILLISP